jgi:hypothetical protein
VVRTLGMQLQDLVCNKLAGRGCLSISYIDVQFLYLLLVSLSITSSKRPFTFEREEGGAVAPGSLGSSELHHWKKGVVVRCCPAWLEDLEEEASYGWT